MLLGNLLGSARKKYRKISAEGICFDSRKVRKKDIFFAIKGTAIKGNKFIKDAIKNGAKTVVSNQKFKGLKNNILYIRAKNVRKVLSEIAFKINKKNQKI